MRRFLAAALLLHLPAAALAQPDSSDHAVRISVDPRIELMSVVQLLNEYMLVTSYNSQYKQDASAYFQPYADHAAVRLFGEMSAAGFAFDAVPKAMLALTSPPELGTRKPFPDRSIAAAGGVDSLTRFVDSLRDFAEVTDFQTFYETHRSTLEAVVDSASEQVEQAVDVLANYSGLRPTNSSVILGPLLHHGGFAATFGEGDSLEVYALVGPVGTNDGLPAFGDAERIGDILWHEFSHTFVNALTRGHRSEVMEYASLYDAIAESMRKQAYTDWEIAVNEHVVRAITTRLAYREFGEEAGDEALRDEEERGFRYVGPLVEALESYEANREQYASLADFYPHLLAVFEDLYRSQGTEAVRPVPASGAAGLRR